MKSNIFTTWSFTEKDYGVLIKQNVRLPEAHLSISVSKLQSYFTIELGKQVSSEIIEFNPFMIKAKVLKVKGLIQG